ncbi:hypothetical protein MFLAVUS_004636 [Mucor flavus]|uniref:Sel1 repeat family protein n=1 Tax=Mucor flavus TaxID=439312 RepID=A0ABP9YWM0_9FUNG
MFNIIILSLVRMEYKIREKLQDGIIESTYYIGRNYYNAKYIENDGELVPHYLELKEFFDDHQSYKNANLSMGEIYEHGKDGVSQDYILASRYYKKAYDYGDIRGAIAIMKFYMEGLGVRR